jgi:hypothetical protein
VKHAAEVTTTQATERAEHVVEAASEAAKKARQLLER